MFLLDYTDDLTGEGLGRGYSRGLLEVTRR
jgi:hypothetical protein